MSFRIRFMLCLFFVRIVKKLFFVVRRKIWQEMFLKLDMVILLMWCIVEGEVQVFFLEDGFIFFLFKELQKNGIAQLIVCFMFFWWILNLGVLYYIFFQNFRMGYFFTFLLLEMILFIFQEDIYLLIIFVLLIYIE